MRIVVAVLFIISGSVDCLCRASNRTTTIASEGLKSFKNLTGVQLEAAVIDEISQMINTSQRIHLQSFGISTITKNMLKNFPNIYSINLRSNEIEEIEDESFSENKKLDKIDLMENRLMKIKKKLLSGDFEELFEINFSHNMITSIEGGSFDRIPTLASIDLSYNCLKHLHSDVFKKNSKLVEVYLHDNEIDLIKHDAFNSKTELKILDAANNKMEFIPELELTKIKRFELSYNKISSFDLNYESRERKKTASIEELVLAFNSILKCSELEERRNDIVHLDLTNNSLTDFDDFPSLLNLEFLILTNNKITDLSLHNFEERFPSLKALDVRGNPLDCIDYNYVRNNLQSISFKTDSSIMHRCNNTVVEYEDELQKVIVNEVRSKNSEIVDQLKLNRLLIIILLATFMISTIGFAFFSKFQNRMKLKKPGKGNLIDEIEL